MDLTPYTNDKAIRRKFLSKIQFCEHGKRCKQCCWLWKEGTYHNGYGMFSIWLAQTRKVLKVRAHRFIWTIRYEHTELSILHICDMPLCCNYNHLYAGTQVENMTDRLERNRANMPKGEKHFRAKLNVEKIHHIFNLYDKGVIHKDIASIVGISRSVVTQVLNGKTWQHITKQLKG